MYIFRSDGAISVPGHGLGRREKPEIVVGWENFYRDRGRKVDLSGVAIPRKPLLRQWRLLIVIKMLNERLYQQCKEEYPCYRGNITDLDRWAPHHERTAEANPYAIWVLDTPEPHKELTDLSAIELRRQGIPTETLTERMLHGLRFYTETENHLDKRLMTLCAGSRNHVGLVPMVYHHGGEMCISSTSDHYVEQNNSDDGCRADPLGWKGDIRRARRVKI